MRNYKLRQVDESTLTPKYGAQIVVSKAAHSTPMSQQKPLIIISDVAYAVLSVTEWARVVDWWRGLKT